MFCDNIPYTHTDTSSKSCQQLVVETEHMPPHTPSRTPPSRLRSRHEEIPPIRQCFTPLCAYEIEYVEIGKATLSLTPIPTRLIYLVNNSWWKLKICRLTLLQDRHLHVFVKDTKKYHNPPGFCTLVRLQYSAMLRLLLQHQSLTLIPTPWPNLVKALVVNR